MIYGLKMSITSPLPADTESSLGSSLTWLLMQESDIGEASPDVDIIEPVSPLPIMWGVWCIAMNPLRSPDIMPGLNCGLKFGFSNDFKFENIFSFDNDY